jgi:hypothetical protein
MIKAPFDVAVSEYKNIIFFLEDILAENHIYNKLYFTKKQELIWNLYDTDLLETF